VIGELDNLSDALPGLRRRLPLPLAQSTVQLLRQGFHDALALVASLAASALDDIVTYSSVGGLEVPVDENVANPDVSLLRS
jgi:hypothetical protein